MTMRKFLGAWWPTFLLLAAVACCVGGVLPYLDERRCVYLAQNTAHETKFVRDHVLSWDCYVRVDGKWIPADRWRGEEE